MSSIYKNIVFNKNLKNIINVPPICFLGKYSSKYNHNNENNNENNNQNNNQNNKYPFFTLISFFLFITAINNKVKKYKNIKY